MRATALFLQSRRDYISSLSQVLYHVRSDINIVSPKINKGKYLYSIKQVLINIYSTAVVQVLLKGIKKGRSFKEIILSILSSLLQFSSRDRYYQPPLTTSLILYFKLALLFRQYTDYIKDPKHFSRQPYSITSLVAPYSPAYFTIFKAIKGSYSNKYVVYLYLYPKRPSCRVTSLRKP